MKVDTIQKKIKVTIVEDDNIIREGFSLMISSTPGFQIINTYSNCEAAIANLKQDNPEVLLMDIELPGMNGIDGVLKIKRLKPEINIIIITVYDDDELVFKALCAGASGYLTKNTPPVKLLDAIKEVHEGGAPMSTNIARMVVKSFQKNILSPLSARETKVLELLAKGKSYHIIANELFVDKETIRTHIKNIYNKLEVHSKADAIEKALKQKFI
jgi:DNA-binding NarL/FixJ family response regulator